MFDIGLFELLVVGGVGLVVIGPEKLPSAIKTGALWVGRIKRSVVNTRREIEEHIGADEIRRELRNEEIMASLEKLRETREQLERDIKNVADTATLEHHTDDHKVDDLHDEHGNYIEHQDHDNHADEPDEDKTNTIYSGESDTEKSNTDIADAEVTIETASEGEHSPETTNNTHSPDSLTPKSPS